MYNNHLENNTLELEIILDIILPSLTRWSSNKLDKTLAEQNPVARKTPVIMASFLWSDSWYPLRNNINWNNKTKNLLIDSVFNWHVINLSMKLWVIQNWLMTLTHQNISVITIKTFQIQETWSKYSIQQDTTWRQSTPQGYVYLLPNTFKLLLMNYSRKISWELN